MEAGSIARRVARIWDLLVQIGAFALLALVFATALHNVSLATDVWYYHMPLATRLAGIVTGDEYIFSPQMETYLQGFPLLGELIQGALWRLFGRPEAANLFCFVSLPLFAWFLRRRFAVPLHLSVLSLLAVPLIHIHASSSLVDLPTGCAGAALILLTIQAFSSKEAPSIRLLLALAALAAFGVNTKAFVHPLAALCLGLVGLRAIVRSKTVAEGQRTRYRRSILLGVLLLPLVFWTPLKNVALHHNPYYPFQLSVLGKQLPGTEPEFKLVPQYLKNAPRPVLFAASVLEVRQLPYSDPRRWSPGQNASADSPAYMMGGYLGWYVVFHLALLVFRVVRDRSREVRTAAIAFAAVTALTCILPQSHELRYYMYWIISLISINLWFGCRPGAALIGPRVLGVVATAAACVVLLVTGAAYTLPNGTTFDQMVAQRVPRSALARIRENSTVCVMRYPFNILWAAPFHPPRRYVVKEASRYSPGDCAGIKMLEIRKKRHRRRR